MRVGVLGGGQLAQMMALSGYPLGIKIMALESSQNCPAGLVTEVMVGDYADPQILKELSQQVDVITYEFENVDALSLAALNDARVYPAPDILTISQDRFSEKQFFSSISIPIPKFSLINSTEALDAALDQIGLPAVLKTRRFGYDGKGQYVIKKKEQIAEAFVALGGENLILEEWINFDREISCIAVRNVSGQTAFYDLVENTHINGVLSMSVVIAKDVKANHIARKYVQNILEKLNYVGVLAVEFFEKDGKYIANEMAPRVHNSGHWTIEGACTSQFENHLRAVLDLPLGSTETIGYPAMMNIISKHSSLVDILKIPGAHCHVYGKAERQGRKLGHVTLSASDFQMRDERLALLNNLLHLSK